MEEQGQLFSKKVVHMSDVRPIDKKTGQQKLFATEDEFAPGFEQWADLMNMKLAQTQKSNELLRQDIQKNTEQNARLANSLEKVLPKFMDLSINDANPDLVVGHLEEGQNPDVAIVDSNSPKLPAECIYTLNASHIAKAIGNRANPGVMARILKALKIFGDPRFHHTYHPSEKTTVQKYKKSVMDEVYKRISDPDAYDIDRDKLEWITSHIKPREAVVI